MFFGSEFLFRRFSVGPSANSFHDLSIDSTRWWSMLGVLFDWSVVTNDLIKRTCAFGLRKHPGS